MKTEMFANALVFGKVYNFNDLVGSEDYLKVYNFNDFVSSEEDLKVYHFNDLVSSEEYLKWGDDYKITNRKMK